MSCDRFLSVKSPFVNNGKYTERKIYLAPRLAEQVRQACKGIF
jgi:hypothetical protein